MVWYADDSSAVGSLAGVKKWLKYLQANGPDFGYCPKPAKTILVVKDGSLMQAAHKIFKDDGIKITDQGECILGSVIGTESFREQCINSLASACFRGFSEKKTPKRTWLCAGTSSVRHALQTW